MSAQAAEGARLAISTKGETHRASSRYQKAVVPLQDNGFVFNVKMWGASASLPSGHFYLRPLRAYQRVARRRRAARPANASRESVAVVGSGTV